MTYFKQKPFADPRVGHEGETIHPKVLMSEESVAYQEKRNLLIPLAERHANRTAGNRAHPLANPDDWAAWWTKLYMNEMDRLWKERGDADEMVKS